MAQQAIKRAITYSVVIGTLLSGHNVIASESETPPLFTSETPALVPAFTEDVATQDTLNSPSVSKQEVSTKLQSWLPSEYKPLYFKQLVDVYQSNDLALIWQDEQITKQLEQQLAEVALTGIQPQFGRWLTLLETAQLTPEARDIILSDAF